MYRKSYLSMTSWTSGLERVIIIIRHPYNITHTFVFFLSRFLASSKSLQARFTSPPRLVATREAWSVSKMCKLILLLLQPSQLPILCRVHACSVLCLMKKSASIQLYNNILLNFGFFSK